MNSIEKERIKWVRKYAPGYVGGTRICKKASDTQMFALIYWNDEAAKAHTRAITAENMIKHIQTAIIKNKNIGI